MSDPRQQPDAFSLRDPELVIYGTLKLEVYRKANRARSAAPAWITANRVAHLLHAGSPTPELFQASPYFLRERLRGLNHGTFLRGAGMRRRNVAYAWNEPMDGRQQAHFGRLLQLLGGEVHLALDVQVLHDHFGKGPFSPREGIRCFQERRRQIVGKRPGFGFRDHVLGRLARLQELGIVAEAGDHLGLSPRSDDVLDALDLFIYSPRIG